MFTLERSEVNYSQIFENLMLIAEAHPTGWVAIWAMRVALRIINPEDVENLVTLLQFIDATFGEVSRDALFPVDIGCAYPVDKVFEARMEVLQTSLTLYGIKKEHKYYMLVRELDESTCHQA